MTLEFKTYRVEKVGKLIKETKKRHIWKLSYNGKYYEIKAMESLMSGMFRIMVQDDKLFSAKVTDEHKRRGIELEYEGLNFRFKKVSEVFDLYVNMNRFAAGTKVTVPSGPINNVRIEPVRNKVNAMIRAEPTKQYNEEEKMQMVEKSISESYLVYNQDFDDSDEDEGFNNFGTKEKTASKQEFADSRIKTSIKDSGFNAINIQNKPSEVKGSMQFAFKKPVSSNVNTSNFGGQGQDTSQMNSSANKEAKGGANPFAKFGEVSSPSNNDFLAFDFGETKATPLSVKPLQQRANVNTSNFGWNTQTETQASHDPFADAFDQRQIHSPNVPKMQSGVNTSGVKSSNNKSPIDKNQVFGFNVPEEEQNSYKQNANQRPQTQNRPNAPSSDPFDDFLKFDVQPPQNQSVSNNNPQNVKANDPFAFGFESANPKTPGFNNFGFNPAPQTQVSRSPLENLNFDFNQNVKPGFNEPQQSYAQGFPTTAPVETKIQANSVTNTYTNNVVIPNTGPFKQDSVLQSQNNFSQPSKMDAYGQMGYYNNVPQQPHQGFDAQPMSTNAQNNYYTEPIAFDSLAKNNSNPFDFNNFSQNNQQARTGVEGLNFAQSNYTNENQMAHSNAIDTLANHFNDALGFNNTGANANSFNNTFNEQANINTVSTNQHDFDDNNLAYPNPFDANPKDSMNPSAQFGNNNAFADRNFDNFGHTQEKDNEFNF